MTLEKTLPRRRGGEVLWWETRS